ncbi:MAG TPA: hypothetical protein VKF15_06545 [Nitrososphaerales archaeon]|nr:hypothetical protein [Nitrososphaerales archaeon]
MYVEKLQLEIKASGLGWKPLKPPVLRGNSGVDHIFSFVASSGETKYAFDIYDKVTPVEVISSYVKMYDTDTEVNLVCPKGIVEEDARVLAKQYGMDIVTAGEIGRLFETSMMRAARANAMNSKLNAPA